MSAKKRKTEVPEEFNGSNIGKVMVIQIFRIQPDGLVDYNTFEKHVGKLQTYGFNPREIWFRLKGGERVTIGRINMLIEVYPEERLNSFRVQMKHPNPNKKTIDELRKDLSRSSGAS